jgi:SAM-dependent methyltransferase
LLGGNETFHLVRCRRCGLIYLNPRPTLDEMAQYYPENYEPFMRSELTRSWYGRLAYRVAIAKRCRIASQEQGPGRLLDVGCGDGDFLLGMQDRGWEVHGLDISPVAVTLARQKGLDIFQGELLEASYPEGGFDRVTMWDVLEHLHNPEVQLSRVAQLLKPGGRLVATFPNAHSLDFRLFGPAWTGLDIPRHLYIYTRPALLALLARAGLEVVSSRCVTGGQRVSTWSLEWLIDERVADERRKQTLKRIIYSRAWYWALRLFYFVIDQLNLGSSITYTCQPILDPALAGCHDAVVRS